MVRNPLGFPLVSAGIVVIGALGWVGGYSAVGACFAVQFIHEREIPGLLVLMLVIFLLATLVVTIGVMVTVEHLARLVGVGRKRWRWGAALWYLAAAVASVSVLLNQNYQYFAQYGR